MEDQFTVGPWAKKKLVALQKYLSAYTTILKNQHFKGFIYVDAFAGPGQHKIRQDVDYEGQLSILSELKNEDPEETQYLIGSPRIALEIKNPFSTYVFVETDSERVEHLNRLKKEYGTTRDIRIREMDCNKYLKEFFIENPKVNWKEWRGVVFLDPFGMQVPWKTIEGLGRTGAIEVFLNFPVGMAIQRLLPRNGVISPGNRTKLDSYFGSQEWYDLIYKSELGFFGENVSKINESGHELVKWYKKNRLGSAFKFVSSALLIRNTHGGHLYYLILASQNSTGVKIANDILSQGEIIQ